MDFSIFFISEKGKEFQSYQQILNSKAINIWNWIIIYLILLNGLVSSCYSIWYIVMEVAKFLFIVGLFQKWKWKQTPRLRNSAPTAGLARTVAPRGPTGTLPAVQCTVYSINCTVYTLCTITYKSCRQWSKG